MGEIALESKGYVIPTHQILVTPQVYARFLDRLDAPAQPNPRLRKTLHAKQPWLRN